MHSTPTFYSAEDGRGETECCHNCSLSDVDRMNSSAALVKQLRARRYVKTEWRLPGISEQCNMQQRCGGSPHQIQCSWFREPVLTLSDRLGRLQVEMSMSMQIVAAAGAQSSYTSGAAAFSLSKSSSAVKEPNSTVCPLAPASQAWTAVFGLDIASSLPAGDCREVSCTELPEVDDAELLTGGVPTRTMEPVCAGTTTAGSWHALDVRAGSVRWDASPHGVTRLGAALVEASPAAAAMCGKEAARRLDASIGFVHIIPCSGNWLARGAVRLGGVRCEASKDLFSGFVENILSSAT